MVEQLMLLLVIFSMTALFLILVFQSLRHAGTTKTGSRLMLGGLAVFLFSIPSCAGCSIAMSAVGSPFTDAWAGFWFYWTAVSLLAIFSGLVLKLAGNNPPTNH